MKIKFLLSALVVALLSVAAVYAQDPGGGDPTPIPIDGGLSVFAAAGIAAGAKKYRDYRKKKKAGK